MWEEQKRIIMLVDMQSFYASVEKAAHPQYRHRPLVVSGDPNRPTGIVLAACPLAKARGVSTAQRLGEALQVCPELVVVRPRMMHYIEVSVKITKILETFTDRVEPYSIDEQFCDMTYTCRLFGGPKQAALQIQQKIWQETGVFARIGISQNKVLAKMACDLYAKKRKDGIFELPREKIADLLWPKQVEDMFGVGERMKRHLNRMGIYTIGDLARTPLARLRKKWGINGEVLWQNANGIDPSPVCVQTHSTPKSIGHQMTLPRDYTDRRDIHTILLELAEEVCRRCRRNGVIGRVVMVGCSGRDEESPRGFHRQSTLFEPTHATLTVYDAARRLFDRFWEGYPIRRIGVCLSQLSKEEAVQMTLFDKTEHYRRLEKAMDWIKEKYGAAAIVRAVSLTSAGQAADRAEKIGGHYR